MSFYLHTQYLCIGNEACCIITMLVDMPTAVAMHAPIARYVQKNNVGVEVSSAQGCDIALGQISPQKLAEAVALHEASDATVLVIGDSTASGAGFARESCGEGADREVHTIGPGLAVGS